MSNFLGESNYRTDVRNTQALAQAASRKLTVVSIGPLSAHIIAYADNAGVIAADKDSLIIQDRILGLTMNSASAAGQDVEIIGQGRVTDPSFSFTPGPIWLGNSGALTQSKPATGILVQVATAYTATSIFVNIGPAIKLA